jgi:inner membrane transporter RhtA
VNRSTLWQRREVVPALLLTSMLSIQGGAALATALFATAGAVGVAVLRNVFAAIVLAAVTRIRVRGLTAQHWRWAATLGVTTMAMNIAFYAALARIPLGVAVAITFLGPITVSMIGRRKPVQFLWPVLAYTGVLLLTPLVGLTSLDPLGLFFALLAAVGWGSYILLTARTSTLFGNNTGLTLASACGAVAAAPLLLLAPAPGLLEPMTLALGFAVAMLSTAIPLSIEFAVLRHASTATVGLLLSAEPAIAALVGFAVLDQQLGVIDWVAIVLVCVAALGVVLFPDPDASPQPQHEQQDKSS